MPRLFKRDGIWYAWVPRAGGGTRKVTTNCTDKEAAKTRATELEREAVDPAHAAANQATTRDACDEFIASRVRRGRAEGTLHHYGVKLGHIVRLMPARLADIVDTSACERFIERRLEEGAAQTTIKKEVRAFGAMLNHAHRRGVYLRSPKMVIPELEDTYKPRERFVFPLELVALVNALPLNRAAHVVYIVAAGARWGESVRARLDEDVAYGLMVHLRGTKTKKAPRTVPVPPMMRIALDWSLANAPGNRFDSWTNVRRDLAVACERVGIPPVTPNDLRRTFAMWLRMSGVTPDLIGAALGHTTSRMAELVYGRISPEDLNRLITERGVPQLMQHTPIKPTGLLMGGDMAELSKTALLPANDAITVEAANQAETPTIGSAWTRNRTRDTGIFNPSGIAANVDESGDSAHDRAANGLTFRARARRWLMRAA